MLNYTPNINTEKYVIREPLKISQDNLHMQTVLKIH